jgi:hypothetical protein
MLRGSEVLSKVIFWLENIVYIFGLFLYELLLVPFIYIRLIYNVIKIADFKNAVGLLIIWIPLGLFFLSYGVVFDIYYFLKILCDYKEDDDAALIK